MKAFIRKIIVVLKWIIVTFLISSIGGVLCYRWIPVTVTPLMIIRCFQNFSKGESVVIHHQWVPLEKMSSYMPLAVILSEDSHFMLHHGFDVNAVQEAYEINKKEKRIVLGGSSISQQTAKNVFLWPTSSWIRKGIETYFTVLIECCWSKQRIMEVYLNSIEMGTNIYGIEAVAQRYFGCSASELRESDCALIAVSLPNPILFNSFTPSRYMRKRQKEIRKKMKKYSINTRWLN